MERDKIVTYMRTKRKTVILTFALLMVAFALHYYSNCYKIYYVASCELGAIYIVLALVVLLVMYLYRK